MRESQSFAIGVDRLLQQIRPHGRSETAFPRTLSASGARRAPGEDLQNWFVRLIDEFCDQDPNSVALEDNLAIFARFVWTDRTRLRYANIQTLCATCSLDDYYLGAAGQEAVYLRMDLDYESLGDPFSHPLAHIHVDGDSSLRFALDGGAGGNVVMDFLEFLYRTFFPDKWLRWVEWEWAREFDGFSDATPDPLPRIFAAFRSGQFHVLRGCSVEIDRLKRMLRKRKDELFEHHMDGSDRLILEYPLAR